MAWTKEQQSIYFKNWRKQNMPRLRRHSAKWRAANVETARSRVAKFNTEKGGEYTARYRRKHRARLAERHAKRRALEKRATPRWADEAATLALYQAASAASELFNVEIQVDHIVPLQSKKVCGLHHHGNMRLLTKRANGAKGNHHWPDMWPRL